MEPNFDVQNFKIEIIVHDNTQTFNATSLNGRTPTYQEVIGALESVKLFYVFQQSGINAEAYRKWEQKEKKKQSQKKINNPH